MSQVHRQCGRQNIYSYDHANRLAAASGPGGEASYAYNGLEDRLQQTVGKSTTNYTLDSYY